MQKRVNLVDLVKSFPMNIYHLLTKISVDTAENEPLKVHLILQPLDLIFTEPPRPVLRDDDEIRRGRKALLQPVASCADVCDSERLPTDLRTDLRGSLQYCLVAFFLLRFSNHFRLREPIFHCSLEWSV